MDNKLFCKVTVHQKISKKCNQQSCGYVCISRYNQNEKLLLKKTEILCLLKRTGSVIHYGNRVNLYTRGFPPSRRMLGMKPKILTMLKVRP